MKKYNTKLLAIGFSIIGIVVMAIIGFSYAFFTASVEGNQNANQTVITTADLRLVFNDTNILSLDNALPGVGNSKTFTVTNIGTARQRYDINITNVVNTFINDELVYTITSDKPDGGEVLVTPMPTEESTLLTSSIDPGVTITYEITVKFKEIGSNQNENQGAIFSGKLQIVPRIMGVALGGYVYDESDNALSNVTVELNSDPIITTTDEEGYYEIEDAPIGNHTLYIKQGETVLGSKEITLISSEESQIRDNTIYLPDKIQAYLNIKVENELNIYLKEIPIFIVDKILSDNTAQSDESIDFAQPSSITNGRGLYYTENSATYGEDNTRIYYYRGAVNNNWVSFGGYLWRIVRTTSEGGVKLAYSGDASGTSSAFINTSSTFNSAVNNKYYVGYTYNLSGYTNMPQTNSIIKGIVDTWYNTNLSSYSSYLSDTAVYCNDRSSERIDGSITYYPAYDRLYENKRPTYACPSTNQSRYTVSTETGNGYLQKPIALLNADEIDYAGVVRTPSSVDSYIMENATSTWWWTMSPYYWNGLYASEFYVNSSGHLSPYSVVTASGARASVSLKSCITVSGGNGSKSTPYVLSNSACT